MSRRHHNKLLLPALIAVVAVAATLSSSGQVDSLRDRLDPNRDVTRVIPGSNRYSGRVFLEQADRLLKTAASADYQIVVGNVKFSRGGMLMFCDSAHFYDATSCLEAFGNVRMEQGDTLFIFADRLVYTDSTQLATLYADESPRVKLINRNDTLRTDIFTYNLDLELGYYETGGQLNDDRNVLTSIRGEYSPSTKDALFTDDVVLRSLSDKDTLVIMTDNLLYNTESHIAELNAPSTITSRDGTIFTDRGVYNTVTNVADLYERSSVVTTTGRTLTGDTIFYDRDRGYGEAWGNMIINDTINKMKLSGDYGFYNELTDSAFVTGRALAVDYSSVDSLSLHGDTIRAFRVITINRTFVPIETAIDVPAAEVDTLAGVMDSIFAVTDSVFAPADSIFAATDSIFAAIDTIAQADTLRPGESALPLDTLPEPVEMFETMDPIIIVPDDSLEFVEPEPEFPREPEYLTIETPDTARYIIANPHVRFYRSDLQGVCDSMTYVARDSLLHLNVDPMVWSDNRQIFGNAIVVHLNDSTADLVTLPNTGFMAEIIEDGFYNQMSGREMKAYLADGQLRRLDVSGNVLIVFFPINEEDSTYTKVANAESSFLTALFANQTIERLKMWSQSTETITPLYLAKKSLFFLPGFRWEPWRRPTGHDDLLRKPVDPATLPAESENSDVPDNTDQSAGSEQADSTDSTDTSATPSTTDNTENDENSTHD